MTLDLYSLTGWIPERIFFAKNSTKVRDFETPPERAWSRLFSACSFGDCLITVSTSRDISESQAEALGLVTGHAYAVLDVFQARNGTRLLQLKNPWASKVREVFETR
jgi:Calpain family cysteine protease